MWERRPVRLVLTAAACALVGGAFAAVYGWDVGFGAAAGAVLGSVVGWRDRG